MTGFQLITSDLQFPQGPIATSAGKLVDQVVLPEHDVFVTNMCFGGPDLRTAYITSSGRGRLYSTTWPVPGLRLSYNL